MNIITKPCEKNTVVNSIDTKNLQLISEAVKQVEQSILENEARIQSLKTTKPGNDPEAINRIREEIQSLSVLVHDQKQSLAEFALLDDFSVGQWVCNGSNLPGKIKGIEVKNQLPAIAVEFWRSNKITSYSPRKLTILNIEQLDYIWSGKKHETLVRRIDKFECEDKTVLQEKLFIAIKDKERAIAVGQPSGILKIYDNRIVYCQKRIDFLNQKPQRKESQTQMLLSLYGEKREEKILKDIPIAEINRDKATQQRVKLNPETVAEYAEAMEMGDKFPPIKVKFDGSSYHLYDGFHTTEAAYSIKRTTITAEVTEGTQRDAILASVSVNAKHGLRRSNADKRRAVTTLLEDEEWAMWSNREIARRCKVSESLVRTLKNENPQLRLNAVKYKKKNGKETQMDTSNIGKSQKESNLTVKVDSDTTSNDKKIINNQPIKENSHCVQYAPDNVIQAEKSRLPLIAVTKCTNNKGQIKFMPNQLLQLKLSTLEHAEEALKLLNHQYCQIERPTEFGNSYWVKFLETGSTRVVMAEDLKPVERVSITFTYSPEEYLELMSMYGDRENLERAIKNK